MRQDKMEDIRSKQLTRCCYAQEKTKKIKKKWRKGVEKITKVSESYKLEK